MNAIAEFSREVAARYDFGAAISTRTNPGSAPAKFERGVSDMIANEVGKPARGIYVPAMMLRDLVVGTPTSGGDLVQTDLLAQDFINMLRPESLVIKLGATSLPGLKGNVAIPAQLGAASTSWVNEDGAATESDQSFSQVSLTPHTLTASTMYSRKLAYQATPAIQKVIVNDLVRGFAVALDAAAINGSGVAPVPAGILQMAGIGSVPLGTNGGAPTLAALASLVQTVAQAHALRGSLAFITNSAGFTTLVQTPKLAGYPRYLLDEPYNEVLGFRFAQTENVPANLTKGTGTDLSAIIFGNFADCLIGQWGAVDMLVDPYTYSTSGTIEITGFLDTAVGLRHAQSFAAITDMVTG